MPRSLLLFLVSAALTAQTPPDLARERAEFATWLTTAPNSPYAAVALSPPRYGPIRNARPPEFFAYSATAVVTGALARPARPRTQRMLTLDGVEVEATDAGTFDVRFGGRGTSLGVYRVPEPGTEESDLTIYFRDSTNAHGTYPAGRFVLLVPLPDGRYRADFNRARNPFCAYSSVYPCPVPWPGNTLPARVEAGERYEAHDGRSGATRP